MTSFGRRKVKNRQARAISPRQHLQGGLLEQGMLVVRDEGQHVHILVEATHADANVVHGR